MKKIYTLKIVLFTLLLTLPLSAEKPQKNFFDNMNEFITDLATYSKDSATVIATLITNPQEVSAVTASSPWTGHALAKHIQPAAPQRIWEIGFGPGNVTREIIKKKNAATKFDAVELLEPFYTTLVNELQPTLDAHTTLNLGAAQDWVPADYKGEPLYDVIISTVAFMTLPPEIAAQIMEKIVLYLKPGGTFSFITYALSRSIGHYKWEQHDRDAYKNKLELFDAALLQHFTQQPTDFVFCNIPPTYIYHWVKK